MNHTTIDIALAFGLRPHVVLRAVKDGVLDSNRVGGRFIVSGELDAIRAKLVAAGLIPGVELLVPSLGGVGPLPRL